jgi:DNA segregation ATPase FtsK/SpoIIIE, S-DNA-T family
MGKRKIQQEKPPRLSSEFKRKVAAVLFLLGAIIIILSFFELAGIGGSWILLSLSFLLGKASFFLPLFLIIGGISLWRVKLSHGGWLALLEIALFLIGSAGLWSVFAIWKSAEPVFLGEYIYQGGWIGHLLAWPIFRLFGLWVSLIIFNGLLLGGLVAFAYPFWRDYREKRKESLAEKAVTNITVQESKPKAIIPKIDWDREQVEIKHRIEEKKKVDKPIEIPNKENIKRINDGYKIPPVDLLAPDKGKPDTGDLNINSKTIEETLASFGVPIEVVEINVGPTVTQYAFKPLEAVNLSKITSLSRNISLALAAHPIRIEAPIPGRSLVGIEVPNRERVMVRLRELMADASFKNDPIPLKLCLGRDVTGSATYADLEKMPHLLVAGSTGSGKTIALNNLILSMLYRNSPQELNFIMIDPKQVEFSGYNDLPHLLCPVISNPTEAVSALEWLVGEMERRFSCILKYKIRNIQDYNKLRAKDKSIDPLPYIVVIVDELADLMMSRGREIEATIVRLAQKARAVGINLIVATQRPSVEVITGLIKANINTRIAFQVPSQIDSRTILDMAGAEKLLGRGDMLFVSSDSSKPKRIQAAYVSEKEVESVINFIVKNNEGKIGETSLETSLRQESERTHDDVTYSLDKDPLFEDARRLVIDAGKASASLLQRRLSVGYARAARLLDMLESEGVVGEAQGSKPREILLSDYSEEEKQENKEDDIYGNFNQT